MEADNATEPAWVPQTINDIPAGSHLGRLIGRILEKHELRRVGSTYSPPFLTLSTVGLSSAMSKSRKYEFTLVQTDEKLVFKWYTVNTPHLGTVGIAVAWCDAYPDGIVFYQPGGRGSIRFKIWAGESEAPGVNFPDSQLILRTKTRDSVSTDDGETEEEGGIKPKIQDHDATATEHADSSSTVPSNDSQGSINSRGLEHDPINFVDDTGDITVKKEDSTDNQRDQKLRVDVHFKPSPQSGLDTEVMPWQFCNTNEKMFLVAVATNVLQSSEGLSVMKATIISPNGEQASVSILKWIDARFEILRRKVEEVSRASGASTVDLMVEKM